MSMNIRLPSINGRTDGEQLRQIRAYLFQLVEQLNWVLSTIEKTDSDAETGTSNGFVSRKEFEEYRQEIEISMNELKQKLAANIDELQQTGGE